MDTNNRFNRDPGRKEECTIEMRKVFLEDLESELHLKNRMRN